MAIQDTSYKADLLALYKKMEANPMSIEDFADNFSKITDKQILTAEVSEGIAVSTAGSAAAQTGKTTAKGTLE